MTQGFGSFDRVTPAYYQTFQQGTPYHAGAPGWTKSPWVTWGDNPNLAGRRRLATDGLGAITAISGLGNDPSLGAYFASTYLQPIGHRPGGTSTVANYAPISGAPSGCGCSGKAQSGLGAMDAKTVGIGLALAAAGLGMFYLLR